MKTRSAHVARLVGVLALALWFSGCTDDLYAACTIDPDDPALSACVESGRAEASCVVEEQLQCETRTCAKYQGSEPFCTVECSTDADCPDGVCREFVMLSGVRHCVANTVAQ
ncbi:hypothetical protein FRC98_05345 [Lujinxingia vulgaris]|uniref:Lipoprotein n=1 Tax=Lujinxingia vulgaris TaxID=2600176 RepID=A0A5C6XJF6_9DELT|nr:hypothetical protein [Lujinxingia vulgaris]TXD38320.1 hypothetical protein FRC98_05345 [Lujinxingia vulgaris]